MAAYPYPVIFLPGIMGGSFRDEYPVDPETVWSPFKLLLKSYDRITPHPSDTRYELIEPARVRPDHPFALIYGDFIEELRHNLSPQADQPVPVFPFAYDWRQPLEQIESALGDFIDEVIDRTRLLRHYHQAGYGQKQFPARVNLAGHSMGGLIIAGYLQKHGWEKVDRVASLGTPFRGSIEAVAKTATGVAALGGSSGSSREREMARVTPALYYLLPTYEGAVESADGLSANLFKADSWQPGILQSLASFIRIYGLNPTDPDGQARELLEQMLARGRRHRTRLERFKIEDPKRWLCVVGVNEKTRVRMRVLADRSGQPQFDLSDEHLRNEWTHSDVRERVQTGDTTVPYLGARCRFIPAEQVVCVTSHDLGFWELRDRLLEQTGLHAVLPNMNLAQRLVVSHFRGAPYGKVWGRAAPDLPPGQPWDPPISGLERR
jgi:pimeloyl-ACP methyl ester carboxylesterase